MELLYNPDQMNESELRATFVARENLLEELLSIIASQPDGPGLQHLMISAPRGLGKTTILLMLRLRLQDRGLTEFWQPLKFPEEAFGITDLADLWCEVLLRLAVDTGDSALQGRVEVLQGSTSESEDLANAALALLRDWCRQRGKRLLLMVENLDQLLDQFSDEQEHARLRDVLMNDGTIMMIATATSYFREAPGYEQPLYNFFKVYDLKDLELEEIKTLLSRRAIHDGNLTVETKLQDENKRLRAMWHFTGGNPRLVLMFYRIITLSGIDEVRRALEKLLDEITPYYQAKTQSLAPQQRKILDHLAQAASRRREALTPSEIAAATRLPPNQAGTQLKRLADLGYVTSANIRGRHTYYRLSEPLYSVWYQMRFGREARRRIEWLVTFLKLWYSTEEILEEGEKLEARFSSLVKAGRLAEARSIVEARRYLVEAVEGEEIRVRAWKWVVQSCLELGDTDNLREHLQREDVVRCLPAETAEALKGAGYLEVKTGSQKATGSAGSLDLGFQALQEGKLEEALRYFAQVLEELPNNVGAWVGRGSALGRLGQHEEALASIERALELQPDDAAAWLLKGAALSNMDRDEEALASFERALESQPEDAEAWRRKGVSLESLGRHEEALASIERALELQPDAAAWGLKGALLVGLGRHEEALASIERALELRFENAAAWGLKGALLASLGRHEEALASIERVIELEPEDADTWGLKGALLLSLGRHEEALASIERTLELDPKDAAAWWKKGGLLGILGRHEEALASFDRTLELQSEDAVAWDLKGTLLHGLGRHEEALATYDLALKILTSQKADLPQIAQVVVEAFGIRVGLGKIDEAKQDWKMLLEMTKTLDDEQRQEILLTALKGIAAQGHFALSRELIAESDLEESLFPFARALDYAITGDRALIEKLPPELRSVVEEIVATLPSETKKPPAAQSLKVNRRRRRSPSQSRKRLS